MLAIRERLSDIGGRFVDEQPSTRQTFDALLRYTMNTIAYAPPMFIGHVTVGRHIELGASLGSPFGHVRWLRATGALSILGFESAIAAVSRAWAAAADALRRSSSPMRSRLSPSEAADGPAGPTRVSQPRSIDTMTRAFSGARGSCP